MNARSPAVQLAHRWRLPAAPSAVQLAELAVLVRLRAVAATHHALLVLRPQELQGDVLLAQLAVHVAEVDRSAGGGHTARHVAKQGLLDLGVGHGFGTDPVEPGFLGALQVAAHCAHRDGQRGRDLPLTAAALVLQAKDFSDFAHRVGSDRASAAKWCCRIDARGIRRIAA